jgi:hypothetical protein
MARIYSRNSKHIYRKKMAKYNLVYYKNASDKSPTEEYLYQNIALAIKVKKAKQQQTKYGVWKVQATK